MVMIMRTGGVVSQRYGLLGYCFFCDVVCKDVDERLFGFVQYKEVKIPLQEMGQNLDCDRIKRSWILKKIRLSQQMYQ